VRTTSAVIARTRFLMRPSSAHFDVEGGRQDCEDLDASLITTTMCE
jgi:hypothetical protein